MEGEKGTRAASPMESSPCSCNRVNQFENKLLFSRMDGF